VADAVVHSGPMSASGRHKGVPPLLNVTFPGSSGQSQSLRFRLSFRIGRQDGCDVCVKNDYVSRYHAEVCFEDDQWVIKDLGSANGIFLNGQRVPRAKVGQSLVVKLGVQGPEILLQVEPTGVQPKPILPSTRSGVTIAHYIEHYFGKQKDGAPMGQHTMYVRRAFEHVQSKQRRRFAWIVGGLAGCVVLSAAYALYAHEQVRKQHALAEELFYQMKSLDLDVANLERVVADSHNQVAEQEIQKFRARRKDMEKTYDQYLATLHVYGGKMSEQQKLILRVARIFGECELDMPRGFPEEVNKYIEKWRASTRLTKAVQIAQENGYNSSIAKEMLAQGLPPQFFYLALQESNFDQYSSGPITRSGVPKGMWQFTPRTALKYGLRLGPLVELRRPDPGDDRHHYDRETRAAARYLKDLYSTDAQASGFLVMACYNWGEDQVLPLVRSMPANPRERNFWKLLAHHREQIPKETYDYVFSIVSAAVIGENPKLFGFGFQNPLERADTGVLTSLGEAD
jgi:membrane-bound lytic murein transglycosylase D